MKKVLVLDFGGQYNLLVARRVRECGVYCEIKSYRLSMADIRAFGPDALILTGGPATVFDAVFYNSRWISRPCYRSIFFI